MFDVPLVGRDGIRELVTIGIGKAAGILSRLTNSHIHIHVPDVYIFDTMVECPFYPNLLDNVSIISMEYSGYLNGLVNIIVPYNSAVNLVDLISGEEENSVEMDAVRIETLMEVSNILISTAMSSICSVIPLCLNYRLPSYHDGAKNQILSGICLPEYRVTVLAWIKFEIQGRIIEGDIILLFTEESFQNLINSIINVAGGEQA